MHGHPSYPQTAPLSGAGIILGYAAADKPEYPVTLRGWLLTETGGAATVVFDLYVPAPAANPGAPILAPSAAGTHVGQITLAASGNLVMFNSHGVHYKDGLYIKATGTGVVLGQFFRS